ncbi:hypothetical protein PUN28_016112 [Cardiocondyla obscurior]|uniref:Uncharacterized protein n=1 Tax=Cardiocondyla obscurior TaxID=286306 RepID=A0AAW2ETC1_9HYME
MRERSATLAYIIITRVTLTRSTRCRQFTPSSGRVCAVAAFTPSVGCSGSDVGSRPKPGILVSILRVAPKVLKQSSCPSETRGRNDCRTRNRVAAFSLRRNRTMLDLTDRKASADRNVSLGGNGRENSPTEPRSTFAVSQKISDDCNHDFLPIKNSIDKNGCFTSKAFII